MKKNESRTPANSSRRDFLKLSAAAAVGMGMTQSLPDTTRTLQTTDLAKSELIPGKDPYAIAARFNKFLRVTDVTDGLRCSWPGRSYTYGPVNPPPVDGNAFLGAGRYNARNSN